MKRLMVITAGACARRGCGHDRAAHHHYRRGTDCALCGCGRFRTGLLALLGLA